MVYLTMHSTHFICLYGDGHMVKYHAEIEIGNPLPPLHGLLIGSKEYFICINGSINGSIVKDRSDDPPNHHRTLYHGTTSRSSKA